MQSLQFKRLLTAGAVPTAAQLLVGEIAINLADKKIYSKDASDNIVLVSDGGATSPIVSVNGHTGVVVLNAADVGALASSATATNSSKLENKTKAQVISEARTGLVPETITVNTHPLSGDVSLTASDVGALASDAAVDFGVL